MNLSIIIVSWNVKEHLRSCLKFILENSEAVSLEIFVVDNGSRDRTAEMVRDDFVGAYGNTPLHLIANDTNLGFAKANNQAIEKAKGRYILLLNPDTQVLAGTLWGMVEFMAEHPEAAVAGCHLIDQQGKTVPSVRRFPTVWNQAAIILKLPHLFPWLLNHYLMKDFDYESGPAAVESIRGSFFMIRREVIEKIGGLDERFFIWFEEVDYCRRVKDAGPLRREARWQVMYNPAIKCLDYVGQSFNQIPTFKKQKILTESMLKYFKKWHPRWQYWVLQLLRPIGIGMGWVYDKLKIKNQNAK